MIIYFVILTISIILLFFIYASVFNKKSTPKPNHVAFLPNQPQQTRSVVQQQIPVTTQSTQIIRRYVPQYTRININSMPIPDSFNTEKENIMKNKGLITIPIYMHVVKNVSYNVNGITYNSHITPVFFQDNILNPLSRFFNYFNIELVFYDYIEEDGHKNIGTLLYDEDGNDSISNRDVLVQKNTIFEFLKKNSNLNTTQQNNNRKIVRHMLLTMIDEKLIKDTMGIDIYFVPFLWSGVDSIVIDRVKDDISSMDKNIINPTLPDKAIIFVAQYKVDPISNYVIPNDMENIQNIIDEISYSIGNVLGLNRSELFNKNKLSERKIQYVRHNALNGLQQGNNLGLLRTTFKDKRILLATDNNTKYQQYTAIRLKESIICNGDNSCIRNLNLENSNITNYDNTKHLRVRYKSNTLCNDSDDYYDKLKYSFM